MQKISRRRLAAYAVDQLLAGSPAKHVASQLGAVLIATKRTGQVELLMQDVAYELESRGVATSANVTVAHPMTQKLQDEVVKFLRVTTGAKNVTVHEKVDKSIIGGLRIDTAAHSWDKTLYRRLTDIKEAF